MKHQARRFVYKLALPSAPSEHPLARVLGRHSLLSVFLTSAIPGPVVASLYGFSSCWLKRISAFCHTHLMFCDLLYMFSIFFLI